MADRIKGPTQLNDDIWPQERDFMARPERYRYVRKLIEPKECVFCASAEAGLSLESLKVYENGPAMVVLNKYPYNSGHCLVLPTRHCGDLNELSDSEYQSLSETLRMTVKALQSVYECQGVNVGLNLGKVAGAGLPDHLHWHVIPRWAGDTNFFPLIAETKAIPESLDQSFEKISSYFSKGAS